MKNFKNLKLLLLFVVIGLIFFVIVGCGGSSKKTDNVGDAPPNNSDGPNQGEVPSDVVAKFGVYGFAAVPTAQCPNGTTGGTGGEVTYVSNGAELQAVINKALPKNGGKPQIIYVQGEINLANSGGANQIDIKDISNVSVIGVGTSAVFNEIGINIVRVHNIIVRNVTVHHNRSGQKDAISIQTSGSHIWIDHCELYNSLTSNKDYYDELLSAKNSTEYITFSWNYLHDSWKTSLIGSSDSDTYDRKITYHHNLIENCNSRLPSYRGGTGHIYNNYYKGSISTCINSRVGAKLLIQNNYFDNCKNPIGSWFSDVIGYWYQEGNFFDNCTTTGTGDVDTGGTVPITESTYANTCEKIALPYNFTLETAVEAKASVLAGAGVGKISGPGGSAPGTTPTPTPTLDPYATSTPTPTTTPIPIPVAFVPLIETFENVADGVQINKNNKDLDNPDNFPSSGMSGNIVAGTTVSGSGAISLGSERMAFNVTGLSNANNPILKVTIKNDNGSGEAVSGLKLAVGNSYSTGGKVGESGVRAHGEYAISNTLYDVLTITLNTALTYTNTIQFRGIVSTSSTAGLHIDKIEVVEE